jgi:hypothetical protein
VADWIGSLLAQESAVAAKHNGQDKKSDKRAAENNTGDDPDRHLFLPENSEADEATEQE